MPRDAVPGFPDRLLKLRTDRGLSRQALADAAETHVDSVVKMEHGTRQPSLYLAWRLATALGVELTAFVPQSPGQTTAALDVATARQTAPPVAAKAKGRKSGKK